ncbi:MAG: phosphonate ABC transporter ATP-binding protein [Pseudomonadota bacterium]|jgi:phosphonate transport system ATP-binding protein
MNIQFENTTVHYPDGTCALDAVSFTVPAGQFCVVLGHSGAGKSTLLRTVNGLSPATAGRVIVGGKTVDRKTLPFLRRRIGMVHQHYGLAARASVATNVMAGAVPAMPMWRSLSGLYPAELQDKVCSLIAAVGLEEAHLRRRIERLSGGQQQRVGIARAFMLDPAVILADEPVASLDPRLSREVLNLLRTQALNRGATVLCSLHQLDLAKDYADRIVALQGGRVIFDGPPAMLDTHDAKRIYAKREAVVPAQEVAA